MLIDITQHPRFNSTDINVSYLTEDGRVAIKKYHDIQPLNHVLCEEDDPQRDTRYINWDSTPTKTNYVKMVPAKEFAQMDMRRWLLNEIPAEDREAIFAHVEPAIFSADIEIDIREAENAFPLPELALYPIRSISVCGPNFATVSFIVKDEYSEAFSDKEALRAEVAAMIVDHFAGNAQTDKVLAKMGVSELKYYHFFFDSEREMLESFFDYQRKVFHVIAGWNWDQFDKIYINNRATKLGIDRGPIASPVGKMSRWGIPHHRLEIDLMPIMRKYNWWYIKTSSALSYVGQQTIGVKKVDYDGSFLDLIIKEPYQTYLFYSAVDVVLVQVLHQYYNDLKNITMLAYDTKIQMEQAGSAMRLGDALFWDEFETQGRVYANKKLHVVKDKFEGAFVMDPRMSTVEYCGIIDAKSFYPSAMQTLGPSPELLLNTTRDPQLLKEAIQRGDRVSINGNIYWGGAPGAVKSVTQRQIQGRYRSKDLFLDIKNVVVKKAEAEMRRRGLLTY